MLHAEGAWQGSWSWSRCGLGSPVVFHAGGALMHHLELKQVWAFCVPGCFMPMLPWRGGWSCSGCYPGCAPPRLRLPWWDSWSSGRGRGDALVAQLGLTKAASWPGHQHPTLICAIKVEGKHKQWCFSAPPTLESVTKAPLRPLNLYSSCSFKPWLFSPMPQGG